MEAYYFISDGGVCLEPCKFLNDQTMIGSVNCQNCIHNIETEKTEP